MEIHNSRKYTGEVLILFILFKICMCWGCGKLVENIGLNVRRSQKQNFQLYEAKKQIYMCKISPSIPISTERSIHSHCG